MMAGAAYPSVFAALTAIAREEGWQALYRCAVLLDSNAYPCLAAFTRLFCFGSSLVVRQHLVCCTGAAGHLLAEPVPCPFRQDTDIGIDWSPSSRVYRAISWKCIWRGVVEVMGRDASPVLRCWGDGATLLAPGVQGPGGVVH